MSASCIGFKTHIAKKDVKAWVLEAQCHLWCFTHQVLKPGSLGLVTGNVTALCMTQNLA